MLLGKTFVNYSIILLYITSGNRKHKIIILLIYHNGTCQRCR